MACGTPVVASDRSCMPEVLGDAALLADPEDVRAWVRVLLDAVRRPGLRRRLSREGMERARRFSWERMAAETAEIYRLLMGDRRA